MSIDSKKRRSLPLKVCFSLTRSYDSYYSYRYLSSWPQWPHHNFTRKHDVEKILFLTTFCRRLSSLVNQAGTLPLALCREKGSMKTKNGFDAFTHLSPAPDVQIEKERFSEVRRVLALRVPKVSTLSCYAASFFLSAAAPTASSRRSRALCSFVRCQNMSHDSSARCSIASQERCQSLMKDLKAMVLNIPRHRSVLNDPEVRGE